MFHPVYKSLYLDNIYLDKMNKKFCLLKQKIQDQENISAIDRTYKQFPIVIENIRH